MEAIIFCGLQASGKTTFYKEHFLKTHLRISLDMLRTRNRENIFLQACLTTGQKFVVDNTNPTRKERLKYIEAARAHRFRVIVYYFESAVTDAIERNRHRKDKEHIPVAGIRGTARKLEPPAPDEGFDRIYRVRILNGQFELEAM